MKKFKLLIAFMLIITNFTFAQEKNHFLINANIKGIPDGTEVYLVKEKILFSFILNDTVLMTKAYDNEFNFTGNVKYDGEFFGISIKGTSRPIKFLNLSNNENVKIYGIYDNIFDISDSGSKNTSHFNEYSQLEHHMMTAALDDSSKFNNLRDKFLSNHKESPIIAFVICRTGSLPYANNWTLDYKEKIYNEFTPNIKSSYWGKMLENNISDLRKSNYYKEMIEKNHLLPDFIVSTISGDKVRISELVKKNKLTLIDFYSTTCPACLEAIPFMTKAYDKYNSSGFNIIGIGTELDPNTWKRCLSNHYSEVPWSNFQDNIDFGYKKIIGGLGAPGFILVDNNLKIIAKSYLTPYGYIKNNDIKITGNDLIISLKILFNK